VVFYTQYFFFQMS